MNAILETSSTVFHLAANINLFGFVIMAGIVLAFKILPAAHPRLRYVVAIAAFFAAVLMPAVATYNNHHQESSSSSQTTNPSVRESELIKFSQINPEAARTPIVFDDPKVVLSDNSKQQNPSEVRVASIVDSLSLIPQKRRGFGLNVGSWGVGFTIVWLFVAFSLVGKELFAHILLTRLRKSLIPADPDLRELLMFPEKVRLYVSDCIAPSTLGIFRPIVIIPERLIAELPLESAQAIMRHELAHVRWRDPAVNALLRIIRALFWVSFPLWVLERVIRSERESAADRAALTSSEIGLRTQYAESLILVAGWSVRSTKGFDPQSLASGILKGANLDRRVRRLFVDSKRLSSPRLIVAVFVLLACCCATLILPAAQSATMVNGVHRPELRTGSVVDTPANTDGPVVDPLRRHESLRLIETEANVFQSVTAGLQINMSEATGSSTVLDRFWRSNEDNRIDPPVLRNDEELRRDWISELAALGYINLSNETLLLMQRLRVSASFIKEMAAEGYPNLPTELLISYRRNAVSPAYVKEMRKHGYSLSPQMLDDFKRQAVSTAYIEEMAALGYRNLPARTILAFRQQNVSAAFIKEMAAEGYLNLSSELLLSYRHNALGSAYARELRTHGYSLSPQMLVDFKRYNISTAYIEEMAALGYRNLSARTLLEFRQENVSAGFIKEIAKVVSGNISPHELLAMRRAKNNPMNAMPKVPQ